MTGAIRRLPELDVEPDQLAEAMVAEENLPMYHNNCRLADDADRRAAGDAHARGVDRAAERIGERPP